MSIVSRPRLEQIVRACWSVPRIRYPIEYSKRYDKITLIIEHRDACHDCAVSDLCADLLCLCLMKTNARSTGGLSA